MQRAMTTKIQKALLFALGSVFVLAGCSKDTKLFWDLDEGRKQPAYARGAAKEASAPSRPPLDVPPVLRTEIALPHPERIGGEAEKGLPARYRRLVAGEAVRLDARFYPGLSPDRLFSALIDAMTMLNLPIAGVDSAAGVITTDWVRKGKQSTVILFGFSTSKLVRYRFVARIYRARSSDGRIGAQLELRTIGQVFDGGWKNAPIRQKPIRELFAALDERLNAPIAPPSLPMADEGEQNH